MKEYRRAFWLACEASCLLFPVFLVGQSRKNGVRFQPEIPKAWIDAEVESYELPLSYGERARYITSAEYYAIPARTIYRSYPVYRPDKEPMEYQRGSGLAGRKSFSTRQS